MRVRPEPTWVDFGVVAKSLLEAQRLLSAFFEPKSCCDDPYGVRRVKDRAGAGPAGEAALRDPAFFGGLGRPQWVSASA